MQAATASQFLTVPLGALIESKTNPRRVHDDKGLAELTATVRQVGVLEPLLVRAKGGPDFFEIVAGARRFRAAKAAELAEVPVRVLELTDDEVLEVQIVENLQRQDVHPLDEARGYEQLLKRPGYDVQAIADKVGKSRGYVYQRLKLRDLAPAAEKAFADGSITAGHAILLARLGAAEQKQVMSWGVRLDPKFPYVANVNELRRHIEQNFHLDLHGAPWKMDDAALLPMAGACTTCPKRTGANADLFGDVQKKDDCTDSACFDKKRAAFVRRRESELSAKGDVVKVAGEPVWQPAERKKLEKAGILLEGEFKVAGAGKACEHVVTALVATGPQAGHTRLVCASKSCKVHRLADSARRPTSPSTAKFRAEQAERALETKKRSRLLLEVLRRVKAISAEDLRLLADPLLASVDSYSFAWLPDHKEIERLLGRALHAPKKTKVPSLTKEQAARAIVLAAVGEDAFYSSEHEADDALTRIAAHFKVAIPAEPAKAPAKKPAAKRASVKKAKRAA